MGKPKKAKKLNKWARRRQKMGNGYQKLLYEHSKSYTYLYLVKYSKPHKKNAFYKIGVSLNPYQRVFRAGYKTTLVGVIRLKGTEAWACETYVIFHMKLKGFDYYPRKFDGKTECFDSRGYQYIKPYLKENGMKFVNVEINQPY